MPEINASVSAGGKGNLAPAAQAKAITGGTVTFIGVTILLAAVQAALDANVFSGLPPLLGSALLAILPSVLTYGATWLKRNRPV